MKPLIKEQKEFEVVLSKDELLLIRELTQNYLGLDPKDESLLEHKTRLSLFVGASRLLGYNMDDNGCIIRTANPTKSK